MTDNRTLAHLLKYDSIHGRYDAEISHDDNFLIVGGTLLVANGIGAVFAPLLYALLANYFSIEALFFALIGVGFLLVLISFGARRRKGSAKREEKKPAAE